MATIREDVVSIKFDVDNNPFAGLTEDANKMKAAVTGGVNDSNSKLKTLAKGTGKVMAAVGKAAVAGVGAASVAIGGLVTKSVQSFAEYEQLKGGVETLFKKSAPVVQKYAENAYKTAGLSANEYMETVTSFSASLLQSVGGDTNKAAKYADMAISDMSDNANKMGTDMSSIQNAYQGFAKQNYTMLDNLKLGYGGTKEEMARLVKDAAKIDKSVDANSMSYSNIVKAIHAVQVETGIYGTTANEAEKTISGSLASMKAAWSNTLTSLATGGGDYVNSIANLVDSVKIFAKNVIPVVKSALSGVSQLVADLAPVIAAEIPSLIQSVLPKLVQAATSMVQTLLKTLQNNTGNIASVALQIMRTLVNFIASAVPQFVTLAGQLIVALAQGIAQQLPSLIPTVVQGILQLVSNIVTLIPQLINAGIQLILGLAQGLVNALPTLISYLPTIIQSLINGITQSLPLIIEAGIQLIQMLIEGIVQNLPALIEAALSMIDALVQGLITNLPIIIQGALSLVEALVQGLVQNMPMLINAAVSLINGITTGLIQNLPILINVAIELVLALIDGLVNNIPLLISAALQLIVGITKGLLQNLPQIISAALKIVGALAKGLVQAIPKVAAAVPKIIKAIKSGLKSVNLANIGKNMMKGFANGITSMASTVKEKAASIASGAADKIKGFLKINSPSKLTYGFGEFTGEGLALGMQKMKGQVAQAAEGLSTSVTANVEPAVNGYKPSGSSVSNTNNSNTVNNYSPTFTLNMNGASATDSNKRKVKKWIKEGIQETFDSMGRVNPELAEV